MKTLSEYTKQDCVYCGKNGNWLVLMTRNRDSDTVTESNWIEALKEFGGEGENVVIERFNHWLCGWLEYMLINPESLEAIKTAQDIEEQLESYPVLNDEALSNLEYERFYEYAGSELKSFNNWEEVLHQVIEEENTEIEHDSSEYEAIEKAKEILEDLAEPYKVGDTVDLYDNVVECTGFLGSAELLEHVENKGKLEFWKVKLNNNESYHWINNKNVIYLKI